MSRPPYSARSATIGSACAAFLAGSALATPATSAIDTATTALLEEFVAFFPKPRRQVLAQALAKLAGWRAAALSAAEARLNDPALDAAVLAALRQPGPSSGSAPASAGPTPPG